MPRTALFVIDIQHSLAADPATEIPHASRLRAAATAVLTRARAAIDASRSRGQEPGLEIVVVQHEEPPEKGPLVKETQAWGLVFPPREGDVLECLVGKRDRNTFVSNPGLAAALRSRGIGTIVACGVQSECCVLSTCRGALEEGFEVVLLGGVHSTYDTEGTSALEIERNVEGVLGGKGAVIVGWEEWMRDLEVV